MDQLNIPRYRDTIELTQNMIRNRRVRFSAGETFVVNERVIGSEEFIIGLTTDHQSVYFRSTDHYKIIQRGNATEYQTTPRTSRNDFYKTLSGALTAALLAAHGDEQTEITTWHNGEYHQHDGRWWKGVFLLLGQDCPTTDIAAILNRKSALPCYLRIVNKIYRRAITEQFPTVRCRQLTDGRTILYCWDEADILLDIRYGPTIL